MQRGWCLSGCLWLCVYKFINVMQARSDFEMHSSSSSHHIASHKTRVNVYTLTFSNTAFEMGEGAPYIFECVVHTSASHAARCTMFVNMYMIRERPRKTPNGPGRQYENTAIAVSQNWYHKSAFMKRARLQTSSSAHIKNAARSALAKGNKCGRSLTS